MHNLKMTVFQHLLIPRLRRATRIKQEPSRRNKLHFARYFECSIHEFMVYGRREGLITISLGLIWGIADYRVELLFHIDRLTFQYSKFKGLAVLPVVYHAEGNRFLRLLFLVLFGCLIREHVVKQVEKRRLYRLWLGFLERPQSRLHLRTHLVGGHGVGEAVHLPKVPGNDPSRLLNLLLRGIRRPAIAKVLNECLKHVDTCDK